MPRPSRLIPLLFALGLVSACTVSTGGGGAESARMDSVFRATNNYLVVPGPGAGEFTVLGQAGAAGRNFFCAAGDYAYRRLGAPQADRVMLVSSVGRNPAYNGQRTGTFRVVTEAEAPPRTGVSVSTKAGENLQIALARNNNCRPNPIGFFD